MFCGNCKREIPNNCKFCVHCGKKIEQSEVKEVIAGNRNPLSKVAEWIAGVFGMALGYYFGWVLILIVIVPFVLGTVLANWYGKKKGNTGFVNIIMWSNCVSWLFPVIGYFTSGTTIKFSEIEIGSNRKKRLILGYIGLGLSLTNSVIGVLNKK